MIKDRIQLQGFPTMKMPKIKGHVKIRLYNPNTWKQEIIEGENMITNALTDIFASNYCGALNYRNLLPLYSNMLGGVLCFNQNLDISSEGAADDYFIPDEGVNGLIAHAGQTTFSDQSDDVKRGNPLATSQVVTDGVITNAWEWGSAGGNGEIRSIALTHSDVGDAGTGSNSNAFKSMKSVINAFYTGNNAPTNNTLKYVVYFVGKDGYGYRFAASGTTVTIYKIVMPYTQTGLIAYPFNDTGITEHVVSTTASFSTAPGYFYDGVGDHNYLWLLKSPSNRSIEYEKISLTNFTVAAHGTINLDANANVNSPNTSAPAIVVPFDGTYIYLRNPVYGPAEMPHANLGTNGFLKVNISNFADQHNPSGSLVFSSGGCFTPNAANRIIVGLGFVINNGITYHTVGTNNGPATWYENFARTPVMEQRIGLAQLSEQIGLFNDGNAYWVAVSKFYLGTKYNLPTPVTKSNSQNMVITYTLTEVAA